MNKFQVTSVVIILLHSSLSALANVKITPIAVNDNKSGGKSDLKMEEARYQNPMPEYYDRNRQSFITSPYDGSYSGSTGGSAYDRYGYTNNNNERYGSNYGSNYGMRFPASTFDLNSKEKFGPSMELNL
jgi:hypothetical protein